MPPRKKRTAAQTAKPPPMKKTRKGAAAAKAADTEPDTVESFFGKYKSRDENAIGPEDLELDPADRKVLVLAWTLRAQRQGYFTWNEFSRGMANFGARNIQQLRSALIAAERQVTNSSSFQPFYLFAFKFCLTEPGQKIIDLDSAIQMWGIVMEGNPHLPPFLKYLAEQKDYKTVNMDQWSGWLRFTQETKPDCSNYDEDQAWPLLLDNYVEHLRENG